MFASGSYDGQVTGTLNIGGVASSLTLTTIADPGGDTGAAATTATYGLQVFNAGGNEVFGPNQKVANLISQGVATVAQAGQVDLPSTTGTFEGVTSTNEGSIDMIILPDDPQATQQLTVTRGSSANGIGEGRFRITNNGIGSRQLTFYVIRIS